jgi:hypothetical protein
MLEKADRNHAVVVAEDMRTHVSITCFDTARYHDPLWTTSFNGEAGDFDNRSAAVVILPVDFVKFGERLTANPEPSLEIGRCRD